jgi:hypothetical protein
VVPAVGTGRSEQAGCSLNWIKTARGIHGEIVSCRTEDGLQLHGLWAGGSDTVLIHTHGTASAYGVESFEPQLQRWAEKNGWGFLTCNSRGAHVLEDWQDSGAAVELFSDSPKDLKAWLGWAGKAGAKRVILSGHSLGTEKIAHFLRGHETPHVVGTLLLAPSDSPGCQERWEDESGEDYMSEAIRMCSSGRAGHLMEDRLVHAGLLPMTARAYLDFFDEDSDLRRALPFRTGGIENIPIPAYALIPSDDVWNITSPKDYLEQMMAVGCGGEICGCNHDFEDHDIGGALRSAEQAFFGDSRK